MPMSDAERSEIRKSFHTEAVGCETGQLGRDKSRRASWTSPEDILISSSSMTVLIHTPIARAPNIKVHENDLLDGPEHTEHHPRLPALGSCSRHVLAWTRVFHTCGIYASTPFQPSCEKLSALIQNGSVARLSQQTL